VEIEFLRNALRFDNPQLPELNSAQWKRVLAVADRERLTLALGQRWKGSLPESVAARIDQNRAANALRLASLRDLYAEIADELQSAGVEFAVLKGFSHGLDRPVGDLDLFCRQHSVFPAQEALARLGYLPLAGTEDVPTDHVPPRMRPTPWVWRGDYFDLEAPIAVELHYQLWDQDTERMRLEGLDEFWFRRRLQCADGFCFPALAGADRIGYAALHLVRHVLRGDFRLFHAYELAQFLHGNPGFTCIPIPFAAWKPWGSGSPRIGLVAVCRTRSPRNGNNSPMPRVVGSNISLRRRCRQNVIPIRPSCGCTSLCSLRRGIGALSPRAV